MDEEKFKNILEENDINKDDFLIVIRKFGNINSLDVKSSNGSSHVIISDEK